MNWKFSLKDLETQAERSHSRPRATSTRSRRFFARLFKIRLRSLLKLINENKYSWDFLIFFFLPPLSHILYVSSNIVCVGREVLYARAISPFIQMYHTLFLANLNINIFWILFELLIALMRERRNILLCFGCLLREKCLSGNLGYTWRN